MNKNAIQKFAIWARNELIAQVSQRAYQYGIDESGFGDASADTLNGRLLTAEEKSQRQELIKQIREKGYQQVMEEIKRGIESGVYATGEKIPSEAELSEMYSVSRITVRRAVEELVERLNDIIKANRKN